MKKTISTILLFASIYAGAQTTNQNTTTKLEPNTAKEINYNTIKLNFNSKNKDYFLNKTFDLMAENNSQKYDFKINSETKKQPIPKQNTIPEYIQKELKEKNNYQPSVEGTIIKRF